MRRRVVTCNLAPATRFHRGGRLLPDTYLSGDDGAEMRDHAIGRFLRIVDAHPAILGGDGAGVADLPAGLRIERSAFEEDLDVVTFHRAVGGLPILAQGNDRGVCRELRIARERGFRKVGGRHPAGWQRPARPLFLGGHRGAESFLVDVKPALCRELAREVDGETKGVMQFESGRARDGVWVFGDDVLEVFHAFMKRVLEPNRFLIHPAADLVNLFLELRIVLAHHPGDIVDKAADLRVHSQPLSMGGGSSNQPAYYVAPPFSARCYVVEHYETCGADVVGHDSFRERRLLV